MSFGQYLADFEKKESLEYHLSQKRAEGTGIWAGEVGCRRPFNTFLFPFPAYLWWQEEIVVISKIQAVSSSHPKSFVGTNSYCYVYTDINPYACASYSSSFSVIVHLSQTPGLHSCTAWGFFSGILGVSLYGLGQTDSQGYSGNCPKSGFCTLWVEADESLEKIMFCKTPSGPCKHKGDGLPLVFRKICERDTASAFSDWNYYFPRSCWRAALQMNQWEVGWESLTIHLLLGGDLSLKPEIHFYACSFYVAFLSEVRFYFPALRGLQNSPALVNCWKSEILG